MIDKRGRRTALAADPPIPPHMRVGRLSAAQVAAFAETDRLTNKTPAGRAGRAKREKATASAKTVAKTAARSRKALRKSTPAPAPAIADAPEE